MSGTNVPKFTSFIPKDGPIRNSRKSSTKKHKIKDRSVNHLQQTGVNSWYGKAIHVQAQTRDIQSSPNTHSRYLSDTRGDKQNLQFTAPNKYHVPKYNRYGSGQVLGAQLISRIDRSQSTSKEIVLSTFHCSRSDHSSVRSVNYRPLFKLPFPLPFSPSPKSSLDLQASYIPFSHSHDHAVGELDKRHLDSMGMLTDSIPLCPSSSTSSEIQFNVPPEMLRQREQLQADIHSNPANLQAWVNLAQYEEKIYLTEAGRETVDELSGQERRGLEEVRIAIYEKALKNPQLTNIKVRSQILLRILRATEITCDVKTLATRWDKCMIQTQWDWIVWKAYVDFYQSNITIFLFDDCIEKYLLWIANTLGCEHAQFEPYYVFTRLTRFIYEAGYVERAVGLWQAAFEFCLFRPPHNVSPDFEARKINFEKFWDSEVLRIGEPGAQGWCHTEFDYDPDVDEFSGDPPIDTGVDVNPGLVDNVEKDDPTRTLYYEMIKVDWQNYGHLSMPGRLKNSLVEEEDPLHTVLSSDILQFTDLIDRLNDVQLLTEAFLCFCGLPPLPLCSTSHPWQWTLKSLWTDPFLYQNVVLTKFFTDDDLSVSPTLNNMDFESYNREFTSALNRLSKFHIWTRRPSTDQLISIPFAFHISSKIMEWARNILQTVEFTVPSFTAIKIFRLALDHRLNVTSHPSSVPLVPDMAEIELQKKRAAILGKACAAQLNNPDNSDPIKRYWKQTLDQLNELLSVNTWNEQLILCKAAVLREWLGYDESDRFIWRLLDEENDTLDERSSAAEDPTWWNERRDKQIGLWKLYIRNALKKSANLNQAVHRAGQFREFCLRRRHGHASNFDTILAEGLERCVQQRNPTLTKEYIEILLLTEYLKEDRYSRNILGVIERVETALPDALKSAELITCIRLWIYEFVIELAQDRFERDRLYSPREFRNIVKILGEKHKQVSGELDLTFWKLLQATTLLQSMVESCAVENYNTYLLTPTPITGPLYHLFAQLNRDILQGNATRHSVQAAFQKLTSAYHTRYSPALWSLFTEFELQKQSLKHATKSTTPALRSVFLRAVTHLPWNKHFFITAFRNSSLLNQLTTDELGKVFDLLYEKELRSSYSDNPNYRPTSPI